MNTEGAYIPVFCTVDLQGTEFLGAHLTELPGQYSLCLVLLVSHPLREHHAPPAGERPEALLFEILTEMVGDLLGNLLLLIWGAWANGWTHPSFPVFISSFPMASVPFKKHFLIEFFSFLCIDPVQKLLLELVLF